MQINFKWAVQERIKGHMWHPGLNFPRSDLITWQEYDLIILKDKTSGKQKSLDPVMEQLWSSRDWSSSVSDQCWVTVSFTSLSVASLPLSAVGQCLICCHASISVCGVFFNVCSRWSSCWSVSSPCGQWWDWRASTPTWSPSTKPPTRT